MTFHDPWILLLLPLGVGFVLWARKNRRNPSLRFPDGQFFDLIPAPPRVKFFRYLFILRALAVAFFILALARPQFITQESRVLTEGIDILIALDVSGSMLAEDFQIGRKPVSRLAAAKMVIREFVQGRPADRIGLVGFADHAQLFCPLTRDSEGLLQYLEIVNVGMIEDETALGSGLSLALQRVKDTSAKGKVVILLTDGRNNAGKISPLTAAAAARALNVTVYSIGAGSKGPAPYPMKDPLGRTIYKAVNLDLDEEVLQAIARQTGGEYFRAGDMLSLQEIFKTIDRLEKTPWEEKIYFDRRELFPFFLIPGLLILALEMGLKNSIFRMIP